MHSRVLPNSHVVFRLQNGLYKSVEVTSNTSISIPKYGTFSSNTLIGKPYYVTYEIVENAGGDKRSSSLRPVPAAELHAEVLGNDASTPSESRDEKAGLSAGEYGIDLVDDDDGKIIIRNNRLTVDDSSRQALSHEEIEELKRAGTATGKEIIEKIMAAHSALDEKTQYSLAKYTLRKTKKYMKRFTVLPMDVGILVKIWLEKDAPRILELREDTLGLMMSWSNVHRHDEQDSSGGSEDKDRGRYLVVDDSCGLVVAAVADRMGILYRDPEDEHASYTNGAIGEDAEMPDADGISNSNAIEPVKAAPNGTTDATKVEHGYPKRTIQASSNSNSITLLHANNQPNISLLDVFGYSSDRPNSEHPLFTHLKTLSWLQLLHPNEDPVYRDQPAQLTSEELHALRPGKRSAYWKKRRRWERVKSIVDGARRGEFDSLIIASTMDLVGVLKHLVPLVRGGGNVVIYSPTVEPLTLVMDLYSRDRRAGYVKFMQEAEEQGRKAEVDEEDFPVDPTLLLNPMLQTARAKEWQILPMRTHPLMTSRGGSEGYIFSATKVIPAKGVKVEAKGKFGKKRKAEQAQASENTVMRSEEKQNQAQQAIGVEAGIDTEAVGSVKRKTENLESVEAAKKAKLKSNDN